MHLLKLPAMLALCAVLLPATTSAETFAVRLGKTALGTLVLGGSRSGELTLTSRLTGTPMGVFNGSFEGRSEAMADAARKFTGQSRSSRKSRDVITVIGAGKALETRVTPAAEMTALSDVSQVPQGVRDPVAVVAALVRARGCPAAMRIYDGRRAIALSPAGENLEEGTLRCEMDYRVIAGPAHLSPLGIRSAQMTLDYAVAQGAQDLRRIRIGSGLLNLTLDRSD